MKSKDVFTNGQERALQCLSIKGWSSRSRGRSLKCLLDSLGKVVDFIYYLATQSTFVKLVVSSLEFVLSEILSAMPGSRAELITCTEMREVLADRGSPRLTALVSRCQYFTETAMIDELEIFGKVRAIQHYYSARSRVWVCKATFYEAYSLEGLLRATVSKVALPRLLGNCKIDRMDSRLHSNYNIHQASRDMHLSNMNKGCQNHPLKAYLKKREECHALQQRCKSTGKRDGPTAEIPLKNIFRRHVDYMSTALGIIKSRAKEMNESTQVTGSKRNQSLDSKMTSDTTKANSSLKKVFKKILSSLNFKAFALNETSFLNFPEKKPKSHKVHHSIDLTFTHDHKMMIDTRCSYLSDIGESGGFTVCEVPGVMLALHKAKAIENSKEYMTSVISTNYYIPNNLMYPRFRGEPNPAELRASCTMVINQHHSQYTPKICYFTFPTTI